MKTRSNSTNDQIQLSTGVLSTPESADTWDLRKVIFAAAIVLMVGPSLAIAQTTFLGEWDHLVPGVYSETIDETEDPYWHDGSHYRPGYIYVGEYDTEGGLLADTTHYQWKAVISEPRTDHLTSNQWSVTEAWSAGRPDATIEARIVDSRSGEKAIQLPGLNEDAATASSLTVYDAASTSSQVVIVKNGTLNLTPASVFDPALKVGVARVTGENRDTQLFLSGVTLTSSGIAELGKGLPTGSGAGYLAGTMDLLDNSRWLHPAGLIEIGGGNASGRLSVATGSLVAGSLFPGASLDPQVLVHSGSSLRIEADGTARLSEIHVNSTGTPDHRGLSVAGSLETQLLVVGENSPGTADFGPGSISTIGTPNPNDPYIPRLALAQETGDVAGFQVLNSNVTVHSDAQLGGYGQATVNIEQGGVLDIRGRASVGKSTDRALGSGTITVTGAGSVLRAHNLEMGYNYGEYRGDPSPTALLTVGNVGRVEIAGETQSYDSFNWGTGQTETITYNYPGSMVIGKGGTLDFVDGTGKVHFTDPSQGGALIGQPRLISTGTIKGGGTGPGPEAQIDFGATGGTLVNKGTIDVGHSPGWLTVNGDVSFGGLGSFDGNGRLKIELGGTNAGFDYDVFEIRGDADFTGGILELSFLDGYTPLAGDYWDFLRVSGGITGWFSSFVVTQGYESYLTALQGWNGESNFRLHADDLGGGGGGGGSSVPDGGVSGVLLTTSLLGLLLVRARKAPTSSAPTKSAWVKS